MFCVLHSTEWSWMYSHQTKLHDTRGKPETTLLSIDFISGNGLPRVVYCEIWEEVDAGLLSNHVMKTEREEKKPDILQISSDRQIHTDPLGFLLVTLFESLFLTNWIESVLRLTLCSARAVRYVMHIQKSFNQANKNSRCAAASKQEDQLLKSCVLSKVNPTLKS